MVFWDILALVKRWPNLPPSQKRRKNKHTKISQKLPQFFTLQLYKVLIVF